MATVNLILVTYDRADEVQEVVEAIERYARTDFVLTVVDNHSGPEMQAALRGLRRRHPSMRLVRNFANRFCGGATNQALALSREDYAIYLCAHECFPMETGWDVACVEFMEARPRVAQAGHLIASPAYPNGRGYQQLDTFKRFRNPEYAEKRADDLFFHVQGGFYILRMEAVQRVGAFNPEIPHNHMDVEYSYYLESEGWRIADLPFVSSIHRNTRPVLEGYDPSRSVYHPLTPDQARAYEAQKAGYARAGRQCTVCGWKGRSFRDMRSPRYVRPDAVCPRCGCHERHRALIAHLEADRSLEGLRVLDIAPVERFRSFFTSRGATYHSLDRFRAADIRGDLTCLPLPDASFDLVVCYHVLEHIPDDRAAVAEIRRILRPGGRALIQVPQNVHRWRTVEFENPDLENHGHVRDPGLDYGERLSGPGVRVQEEDLALRFPLPQRVLHGFYKATGLTYTLEREA